MSLCWDPATCLDGGECDACIANGGAVAAELASWFYCEGCAESFPLEDEEGGDGLCGSCAIDAELAAQGCHWCGPGVPATTESRGHAVCFGCAVHDEDADEREFDSRNYSDDE